MVEKSIKAAQELIEALKHLTLEASYSQIGYNQLSSIDALAKIFSQQVQEKGSLTISQNNLRGWEVVNTK